MPTSNEVFQRIVALGLEVPPTANPGGLYDAVTVHGGIAYTSGQLSRVDNSRTVIAGRMKVDSTLDEAIRAARIHRRTEDLSRISRLTRRVSDTRDAS